jgi:glucosamine--fructose-6-phosphate aminotransferase (isomerizing)
MTSTEFHSYAEIASQPETWAELLPLVLERAADIRRVFTGVESVLFTGCGSGLNASTFGAAVVQEKTGIPARAVPAADIYLFPESVLLAGRHELAVLSSRSGETTEVRKALDTFKERGVRTIGITCTADSSLARESDLAFVLTPVVEQAVITSRSFTGMLLVMQLLAAVVAGDDASLAELRRLPDVCGPHMQACHDLGRQMGERTGITRYAFVGNGPFYGIAREGQLKVKEMALLPADSYPMLDFRHGPQSNVDGQMLITAFLSDSAYDDETQFLGDMKALGGITLALSGGSGRAAAKSADYALAIDDGLSQYARAMLYMPAVQYMAYYRALSRDLNPDRPRNLDYWIDTTVD